MNNLGKTFFEKTSPIGFVFPRVLLPKKPIDLQKWAVIACDQHTSDVSYWNKVAKEVGDEPSTLGLMYPEVYLGKEDPTQRIQAIHHTMKSYLNQELFEPLEEGFVYVERFTKESGLRQGVILAMDLEHYDYSPNSKSLIRATEGTIVDRLPPRVNIRKGAPLELPHIMILIDDQNQTIIEPLGKITNQFQKLYDTDLMLDGGTLKGYSIQDPQLVQEFTKGLNELAKLVQVGSSHSTNDAQGFLFAMGDGNHSLATAKKIWEAMKAEEIQKTGSWIALENHPARYALAEVVNLHSPGLRFEPIHRIITQCDPLKLIEWIRTTYHAQVESVSESQVRQILEKDPKGQRSLGFFSQGDWKLITLPEHLPHLPNDVVDTSYEAIKSTFPKAEIDFIHGWEHTKHLSTEMNGSGWLCPVISRDRLFSYVREQGPLPRKAFSMGDAQEKRYYMEVRKITS